MFRKKREPAPFFRMPGAPFNPATGEHAQLQPPQAKGTVLALFQVVEDDTHDNYVVCRGYEADNDHEFRFLHDPYTVPTTTPINVAKPYALRGTNPYVKGDVIVAARIKGKLGYNPGKGVTVGQPADLDEVISLLSDDANVGISWLDLGSPSPPAGYFETPVTGFSAGVVSLSATSEQAGDFAEVPGTNDRVNILKGTNLPYLVTATLQVRAELAGENVMEVSAYLYVGAVMKASQGLRVYTRDFAHILFALPKVLTLSAGEYVQILVATAGGPSPTVTQVQGSIFFLPLNR